MPRSPDRFSAWQRKLLALERRPWVRPAAFAVAVAVFGAGIYLSVRVRPSLLAEVRWRPYLLLLVAGVPATLLLHAAEFRALSKLFGQDIGIPTGLRVSVLGSAANTLPVPGALGVRILALRRRGASVRRAIVATTLLSIMWLGVALVYAGLWLHGFNDTVSLGFLGSGTLVLAAAFWHLARSRGGLQVTLQLLLIKLALVLTDAGRLYLSLLALGAVPSIRQASVLTASSALGAAVLLVPGGLGFQEALAAALSPLVDLGPSSGFLAATLNRLANMLVLLPLAGLLARSRIPSVRCDRENLDST